MNNKLTDYQNLMNQLQQFKEMSGSVPRQTALDNQGLGYIGRPIEEMETPLPTEEELQANEAIQNIDWNQVSQQSPVLGRDTDAMSVQEMQEMESADRGQPLEESDSGSEASQPSSSAPVRAPQEDRFAALLQEYQKARNQYSDDISKAAEKDRQAAFIQSLGESLGKAITYSGFAGGNVMSGPIPLDFKEFKPNYLQEAKEIGASKISSLKEQIELMNALKKEGPEPFKTVGGSLLQYNPETGKYDVIFSGSKEDALSLKDKLYLDLNYKKLTQQDENFAAAEERRARQQEIAEKKAQLDSARALLKDDPRFKPAIEQSVEFETVKELLDEVKSGNATALSALGTKFARAMGEVGVLTDTDVVRYIQSQKWADKLKGWFTRGAQGTLPSDVIEGLTSNIDVIGKKLNSNINKVYDNASGRLKATYPEMSDEDVQRVLGMRPTAVTKDKQSKEQSDLIPRKTKDGKVALFDSKTKKFVKYQD